MLESKSEHPALAPSPNQRQYQMLCPTKSLFNAARDPRTNSAASPARRNALNPSALRELASLRPPHLLLSVNESRSTTRSCSTQRILQLLLFFLFAGAAVDVPPLSCAASSSRPRTAISMAVSKISCTPFISLDEHSMYIAPIFSATARPCCCVTGVRP